jgi:hypothetical protein
MNPALSLIYPMLLLVIFTFAASLRLLMVRNAAINSGTIRLSRYRAQQGDPEPELAAATSRAYSNLLESPQIFFFGCLALLALDKVDPIFVTMAWAYVGLRIAQSLIHLTYNNIMHRFAAYLLGWAVMLAIWVRLVLSLQGS